GGSSPGSFFITNSYNRSGGTIASTLGHLSITQASGSLSTGSLSAVNALDLTASAGTLNVNGTINVGSGGTITLGGADMNITAPVNAGTGTVTINNLSGGAVTLGGGLSGFGLSNAELNQITAGTLALNLSPVTVDGAVSLGSGVGNLFIYASSTDVNNNFQTAGNLYIVTSAGDLAVNAGASPVTLSGSSVTLALNGDLLVNGGTAINAFAKVDATAGDLVIHTLPASASVKLTDGPAAGALALLHAAGSLLISGATSVQQAVSDAAADQQQNTIADLNKTTNQNTAPPTTLVSTTPPTTGTGTGNPTLTDPHGTVGGDPDSFGGESSSGSGSGGGSGSGNDKSKGGKKPAFCKP
ncbi:MAG TPA: hypothetical protein VN667_11010, partial [Burkholderiales bacterium]|nr:hypothetical protein [Burkholderiales bacterium]